MGVIIYSKENKKLFMELLYKLRKELPDHKMYLRNINKVAICYNTETLKIEGYIRI